MKYITIDDIKAICCKTIIPKGTELEIFKQTSKNRVMVRNNKGQIHKVRFSTFRRLTNGT